VAIPSFRSPNPTRRQRESARHRSALESEWRHVSRGVARVADEIHPQAVRSSATATSVTEAEELAAELEPHGCPIGKPPVQQVIGF